METHGLTRIKPVEGTLPAKVGGVIGYAIDEISHPELVARLYDPSFKPILRLDIDELAAAGENGGRFISTGCVTDKGGQMAISVGGQWMLMPDFKLLCRIASWKFNFSCDEAVTREDFRETYGQAFGDHFYMKWKSFEGNIESMIGYFSNDADNGQRFIGIVMRRVYLYEKRLKERK
jgi:hypothetical protein